jgi:hypothetical protein
MNRQARIDAINVHLSEIVKGLGGELSPRLVEAWRSDLMENLFYHRISHTQNNNPVFDSDLVNLELPAIRVWSPDGKGTLSHKVTAKNWSHNPHFPILQVEIDVTPTRTGNNTE